MKMNLYVLYNKLNQLEKMLANQSNTFLFEFRAIDWRDYIAQPLDNFVRIWKYKKRYFKSKLKLFRAIEIDGIYDKTRNSFYSMIDDDERQEDMWNYGIQVVYAKHLETGRYFTCEGYFLTAANLTLIRGNPNNDKISIVTGDGRQVASRAFGAYATFVDPEIPRETTFMYFDGFFGNCGVDNIIPADAAKSTKGTW